MKVFISWSGELSRQVAVALRDWLPYVLTVLEPYVSSEDIEKGERWGSSVAHELDNANFGIICLTPDNQHAPWINFEAGALAKSVSRGRVSPFLLNMTPADITGPLSDFQATRPELADVERLILALNAASEKPLANTSRVSESVAVWWPRLAETLELISNTALPSATPPRDTRDMMAEVLELTRSLRKLVIERENGLASANALINGRDRGALAVIKVGVQEFLSQRGYSDAKVRLLGDTIVVACTTDPTPDVVEELRRIVEGAELKVKISPSAGRDPWDMI